MAIMILRSINKYWNEFFKKLWTLKKLKPYNDKKRGKNLFSKAMGSSMVDIKASG